MSAPLYNIRPGGFEDEDSDDDGFFLGSIDEDKKFTTNTSNVVKSVAGSDGQTFYNAENIEKGFAPQMVRPRSCILGSFCPKLRPSTFIYDLYACLHKSIPNVSYSLSAKCVQTGQK